MAKKSFKGSPAMNFITHDNFKSEENKQEIEGKALSNVIEKESKPPKISLALYSDNLEYVKAMAGVKGMATTAYINKLIDDDKEKNYEIYKTIKDFTKKLNL